MSSAPGSTTTSPGNTALGLPPRFDDLAEEVVFGRRWQADLAAAGWVGVTWPTAYGGRGLGPSENFVVQEELARARAPELVGRIGINLAGPTLMAHGTEAQKAAVAPRRPPRRRVVVPALLRTRCRLRPGLGPDHGPGRRRRLGPRRSEGLDLLRPVRRLGRLPGPQRQHCGQAQGTVVLRRRHARRRGGGPPPRPADRRGRVQRGDPPRGLRARRPTGGRRRAKAGGWPAPPSPTNGG